MGAEFALIWVRIAKRPSVHEQDYSQVSDHSETIRVQCCTKGGYSPPELASGFEMSILTLLRSSCDR